MIDDNIVVMKIDAKDVPRRAMEDDDNVIKNFVHIKKKLFS